MTKAGEIPELLQKIEEGDANAANALFARVERDLVKIARHWKRVESVGDQAETTILVNDAFLRLIGSDNMQWEPGDRRRFFGYAATVVHNLLIDMLRSESAAKRGGGRQRRELVAGGEPEEAQKSASDLDLLLDLKDALAEFETFAPDNAAVFRLKYLVGCTFDDIADILTMPNTTVQRRYAAAKSWLRQRLKEYQP